MKSGEIIGVFDSGVGGLSVFKEVKKLFPAADIYYFGDTAHVPYGPRSAEELTFFADQIVSFLLEKGVTSVVDACNSTSSVALDFLLKKYTIPMVGVVEPGARVAAACSKNGRIGVIATQATINSGSHRRSLNKINAQLEVFGQACPLFVPLVEKGEVFSARARETAIKYLAPLKEQEIDTLILGCTHYPFLVPVISEVLGPDIMLVDPAVETVSELKEMVAPGKAVLRAAQLKPQYHFFVSGDPDEFYRVGRKLLAEDQNLIEKVQRAVLNEGLFPTGSQG